jgi:hypothetical protein
MKPEAASTQTASLISPPYQEAAVESHTCGSTGSGLQLMTLFMFSMIAVTVTHMDGAPAGVDAATGGGLLSSPQPGPLRPTRWKTRLSWR